MKKGKQIYWIVGGAVLVFLLFGKKAKANEIGASKLPVREVEKDQAKLREAAQVLQGARERQKMQDEINAEDKKVWESVNPGVPFPYV